MVAEDSSKCLDVVMEVFVNAVYIRGTPENLHYSGPVVSVLRILEDRLGLCFRLFRAEQRHEMYGKRLSNGSWTGIIGQLQQKEVDFAGTLFTVTSERSGVLDFSEHIYLDEITAAHARPRIAPNMAGFVQPYTFLVWLLILMASLLVLGTLSAPNINFMQRSRKGVALEQMSRATMASRQTWTWLVALQKSALWTWATLLAQSVSWYPSHGAVKVVAGLWLLAAFMLGSVYRSNLKAMLIIPKLILPFDNLEELADSNIPVGVFKGSTIHLMINDADSSSILWRLNQNLRLYYNYEANLIIMDMYLGNIAAISFSQGVLATMHNDFSKRGECRIYRMSRGILGPTILSLAFPKGSPLKEKFDPLILRLRESGIMNKLFWDILFNATECAKPVSSSLASSNMRPLEVIDFFGVFSLYVVGQLGAVVVFLVEVLRGVRWHHCWDY